MLEFVGKINLRTVHEPHEKTNSKSKKKKKLTQQSYLQKNLKDLHNETMLLLYKSFIYLFIVTAKSNVIKFKHKNT